MSGIRFHEQFDDFIVAPALSGADISSWFREKTGRTGIYTVFNRQFEPLYIGSAKDMKRRLSEHRSRGQLTAYLEDILFIGINFTEGSPISTERKMIRELTPKLNVYRYGGLHIAKDRS